MKVSHHLSLHALLAPFTTWLVVHLLLDTTKAAGLVPPRSSNKKEDEREVEWWNHLHQEVHEEPKAMPRVSKKQGRRWGASLKKEEEEWVSVSADANHHNLPFSSRRRFLKDKTDGMFEETKQPKAPKGNNKKATKGGSAAPSAVPSAIPSFLPSPLPPIQCFQGDADSITSQCTAAEAECCTSGGCTDFDNATVCERSCNGFRACSGIGNHSSVGPGSCNGPIACFSAGFNSSITIGTESCLNSAACVQIGAYAAPGSQLSVGNGSCILDSACAILGQNASNTVSIGSNSCLRTKSCYAVGFQATDSVLLGDNLCQGQHSCNYVGFQSPANIVSINDGSCNPDYACAEFSESNTTASIVSIGMRACNSNVSQCSGIVNTDCQYGTGMYGTMIPDDGIKC